LTSAHMCSMVDIPPLRGKFAPKRACDRPGMG
jgi:hypothetical protein